MTPIAFWWNAIAVIQGCIGPLPAPFSPTADALSSGRREDKLTVHECMRVVHWPAKACKMQPSQKLRMHVSRMTWHCKHTASFSNWILKIKDINVCMQRKSWAETKAWASVERIKGNEMFKVKDYERAITLYNKAIDLDPSDAESYGNRAAVLSQLRAWELSVADCTKALSLKPK